MNRSGTAVAAGLPVNLPAVVAAVQAASDRYEAALQANDLVVLDELFWDSPLTLRYGASENLHGIDAIRTFRVSRPTQGLARMRLRREITTHGQDFATVNLEFRREGDGRHGRQSQAWVRFAQGWRVVAAHVSLLPPDPGG